MAAGIIVELALCRGLVSEVSAQALSTEAISAEAISASRLRIRTMPGSPEASRLVEALFVKERSEVLDPLRFFVRIAHRTRGDASLQSHQTNALGILQHIRVRQYLFRVSAGSVFPQCDACNKMKRTPL